MNVILQKGFYLTEGLIARTYSTSCRLAGIEDIYALPDTGWMPVGSVEFCTAAMRHQGITPPNVSTYPDSMMKYLRRSIWESTPEEVLNRGQRVFVKPFDNKRFTGFVWPDDNGQEDDLGQFTGVAQRIWCSEPVEFSSEWRFYIHRGEVLGCARYDDTDDKVCDVNSLHSLVLDMIQDFTDAPCAYSLDAGHVSTGQAALIEVNDAWGSLGFYTGSCTRKDFFDMLVDRWQEIQENHTH